MVDDFDAPDTKIPGLLPRNNPGPSFYISGLSDKRKGLPIDTKTVSEELDTKLSRFFFSLKLRDSFTPIISQLTVLLVLISR